MVGIIEPVGRVGAAEVADLARAHLVLLAQVDALAAEAVAAPETLNIGLQLKMAAGEARGARRIAAPSK